MKLAPATRYLAEKKTTCLKKYICSKVDKYSCEDWYISVLGFFWNSVSYCPVVNGPNGSHGPFNIINLFLIITQGFTKMSADYKIYLRSQNAWEVSLLIATCTLLFSTNLSIQGFAMTQVIPLFYNIQEKLSFIVFLINMVIISFFLDHLYCLWYAFENWAIFENFPLCMPL